MESGVLETVAAMVAWPGGCWWKLNWFIVDRKEVVESLGQFVFVFPYLASFLILHFLFPEFSCHSLHPTYVVSFVS